MAHGFLSYEEVSGDNFWKNAKWLKEKLDQLRKAKIWPLSNKKLVNAHVSELQNLLVSGQQKKMGAAPQTRMLGAGSGGLATTSGGLVEKNPTNIDVKTGERPQSGPRLPGGPAGPSKGGGFTNIPGIASAGLNAESFFQKAQTGVGDSGEYLTKAQRVADFRKSQEMRSASAGAPPISGDSGVDIVAAVNRNTQMIVSLVDAVKEQTKTEIRLSEKESQNTEKLMLRAAARQEEADLEKGKDLSGFLTPERFKKKEKNSGGGGGGGDDSLLDFLDVGLDLLDIGGGRRGKGGSSRVTTGRGGAAKGGGIARGLGKASKGGGLARGAAGLGKGLMRNAGPLALLGGAFEFSGRKAEGQSNLQAGVGTAASVAGGLAGAAKGAAMGAALGSVVPGLGTAVGGVLGGLIGGFGGSALAGGAADLATGAFANGGLISKPTLSLMGEGNKAEGVFPLEGARGKKTFKLFGEGIFEAQKDNDTDYAKLQSMGLKQYYENEGGFKKMGEGLKGFFAGLGGALGSLFGGAANAGTLDQAGDYMGGGMSADEQQLTESLIAGEEGMRQNAYWDDSGKKWTIGYGMTTMPDGRAVKKGDKLTKEQAVGSLRSGISEHQQRAIKQLGAERWQALDPKARAVLTSLTYNYGSIPDAVLPAAKSGSTEDIAKSMDKLYGHNEGILKGRRQREQSILRGNLQGDAGNAVRLDKDFMAGGKFAGAGTGPTIAGGPGAAPPPGSGGKVIEYITGDKTSSGYRADHGGGNYHDHIAFDSKGTRDAAAAWLRKKGWKIGSMNDGRHADGSYHYSDKAFDIPFYPNQRIKGVTDDGKGETKLSTMLRTDLARGGFSGSGIAALPGSGPPKSPSAPVASNTRSGQGSTAGANRRRTTTSPGSLQASVPQSTPGPVPASPAAANNGTPLMASSQQVAMGTMGLTTQGGGATVINNYYGGGGQQGGGNPNGVIAGIGMDQTGTSAFQPLKIMALT